MMHGSLLEKQELHSKIVWQGVVIFSWHSDLNIFKHENGGIGSQKRLKRTMCCIKIPDLTKDCILFL